MKFQNWQLCHFVPFIDVDQFLQINNLVIKMTQALYKMTLLLNLLTSFIHKTCLDNFE